MVLEEATLPFCGARKARATRISGRPLDRGSLCEKFGAPSKISADHIRKFAASVSRLRAHSIGPCGETQEGRNEVQIGFGALFPGKTPSLPQPFTAPTAHQAGICL